MTAAIILAISILVLIGYLFDVTAPKTRIPTVILLLILGILLRQGAIWFGVEIPDLSGVLPVLGTFGLILIVLEGALDLELSKEKLPMIRKAFFVATIPVFVMTLLLGAGLHYYLGYDVRVSLLNSVPFAIISSAIAIPTVSSMPQSFKAFVTYESSLSDIIGVIVFNFLVLNETFGLSTFLTFGGQLLTIIVISFLASALLSFMLSRIKHHIKFGPIIFLIILIYEIAKIYHLPSLIFILVLGLFLGNLDLLKRFKFIEKLRPDILNKEAHRFREITGEAAFLIRVLFFIVFGFVMEFNEIVNLETLPISLAVILAIFIIRALQLKISHAPVFPLVFIAPRGLITILLFLSIPVHLNVPEVNRSLIVQVIVLSALIMMVGTIFGGKKSEEVIKVEEY
ncbi:MAG: cation:proton antiporter [Flavobacteriales bacterium]